MKKHLQLSIDFQLVDHLGQVVLSLLFRREALRDWCLGLCLLKEGLVEALVVSEEHGKKGVKIQVRPTAKVSDRVLASFESDITRLELTPNNLGYLQHFFLKYYRDGVAEVDHLDLEAICSDAGHNEEIYITFKVPDSMPPLTPEEPERRLKH